MNCEGERIDMGLIYRRQQRERRQRIDGDEDRELRMAKGRRAGAETTGKMSQL